MRRRLYIAGRSPLVSLSERPGVWLPGRLTARGNNSERAMPVKTSAEVLRGENLAFGSVIRVESIRDQEAWVPPEMEKAVYQVSAFLGLFANDPLIQEQLHDIASKYPDTFRGQITDGKWLSHLMAWEYSEIVRACDSPNTCPTLRGHRVGAAKDEIVLRELSADYQEAVLHLCARERMGRMWPPLVHFLIVNYVMIRDHPDGWPEGPTFEPLFMPRILDPVEGALDGYHPIPRARTRTPLGMQVILSPDQPQRKAARNQKDPYLRYLIETGVVRDALKESLGYQRRRDMSLEEEKHASWLFRRHIRKESIEEIGRSDSVSPSTVETAVKNLRRRLDLQPKNGIRCLRHSKLPERLYSAA